MYEQLKGCLDITPLQERLLLLVQLKLKERRVKEIDLLVMALTTDDKSVVASLMGSYLASMFPGFKMEDSLEEAKKVLAEEAGKVLLVRRAENALALTGNPDIDALRLRAVKADREQRSSLLTRLRRKDSGKEVKKKA